MNFSLFFLIYLNRFSNSPSFDLKRLSVFDIFLFVFFFFLFFFLFFFPSCCRRRCRLCQWSNRWSDIHSTTPSCSSITIDDESNILIYFDIHSSFLIFFSQQNYRDQLYFSYGWERKRKREREAKRRWKRLNNMCVCVFVHLLSMRTKTKRTRHEYPIGKKERRNTHVFVLIDE